MSSKVELDSLNALYLDNLDNVSESIESRLETIFSLSNYAPDFLEGIKIFKETRTDFAIINMDDESVEGAKFLKLIKSKHPNFPTMLISGKSESELSKILKSIRVDAIVQPPVDEQNLAARIDGIKPKILKFAETNEPADKQDDLKKSLSIEESIDVFFKKTLVELTRYDKNDKFNRKMDFSIMKTFLYTAYNNFREMDPAFEDEQMSQAKQRLEEAVKMQYDMERRIGYAIETNYENIFLKKQIPYVEMIEEFEATKAKIEKARNEMGFFTKQMEDIREKIKKYPKNSPEYSQMERDYKRANGKHVDRVHTVKESQEKINLIDEQMNDFRKAHFDDFKKVFYEKTEVIKIDVKNALDILAYKFDKNIWRRAKKSRNIREFYAQARIKGLFSSKTYLEYYVGNLDTKTVGAQNAKLVKYLNEYNTTNKLNVAILGTDSSDVSQDKEYLEAIDPIIKAHGFVNDDQLIKKFGPANYYQVIIVYYDLGRLTAFHFIKKFKETHGEDFDAVTFVLKYGTTTKKSDFMNAVSFGFKHFIQMNTPRDSYAQLMLDAL